MSINIIHNINFAAHTITNETFAEQGQSFFYNQVINHGCWCARINPDNDKTILGGPHPQDALDEICKQWYNCRHCNDALSGGSCHASENVALASYDILWNSQEKTYECQASSDTCGNDSCSVDVYYSNLIAQYIKDEYMNFSPITVTDRSVCHPDTTNRGTVATSGPGSQVGSGENGDTAGTAVSAGVTAENVQVICQGTAPHFEIVRTTVNDVAETGTVADVPVQFQGVLAADPITTPSFRMSFDIKLLSQPEYKGRVLTVAKVGETSMAHTSNPQVAIRAGSYRLQVRSFGCKIHLDNLAITSNDIGQDGETVHVEIELYNNQLKIAYGGVVDVTNNWSWFCADPAQAWETRFLAGTEGPEIADAEIYDYKFETDITGSTL